MHTELMKTSGGSKGVTRDVRPPWGSKILSISCSFWENLANLYVDAPPGELVPPPQGNPGPATENSTPVVVAFDPPLMPNLGLISIDSLKFKFICVMKMSRTNLICPLCLVAV